MKAYSQDLRERVLAAVEEGEHSQPEIADKFKIGLSTLEKWVRRQREPGSGVRSNTAEGRLVPWPAVSASSGTRSSDIPMRRWKSSAHGSRKRKGCRPVPA